MDSVLSYAVVNESTWSRMIDNARKLSVMNVHALSRNRFVVIHKRNDSVVANFGADWEKEYFWVEYPVPGDGYSLLVNALSVDTKHNVQ